MINDYYKIPGWFNYQDSYAALAGELPDGSTIVEIGSFLGRSTKYLANSFFMSEKTNVKIYCIDTWEGSGEEHATVDLKDLYEEFRDNLHFYIGRNMVMPLRGRSDNVDFLSMFEDKSVDAIVVDGSHTYEDVWADVYNWWPKLKDGGIMIGDDYNWESVKQGAHKGFTELKEKAEMFVNMAGEATWYVGKGGCDLHPYRKQIPGKNAKLLEK